VNSGSCTLTASSVNGNYYADFFANNATTGPLAVVPFTVTGGGTGKAADPLAIPAAQNFLQYLYNIQGNHTLSGEYMTRGSWNNYQNQGQSVTATCGATPALVGPNWNWGGTPADVVRIATWQWQNAHTPAIIDRDAVFPGGEAGQFTYDDIVQMTTPGTDLYNQWHASIDNVINLQYKPLADAGIPVIFRWFHEANGDWDKYGVAFIGDAGIALLWQDWFTYYTHKWGLHNALFMFSPNAVIGNYTAGYRSQYVDIVGLDYYASGPGFVDGYNEMTATGKPFGLGEFGWSTAGQNYDLSQWPGVIQSQMPLMTLMMEWFPLFPPDYANCSQWLAASRMINLGGVNY